VLHAELPLYLDVDQGALKSTRAAGSRCFLDFESGTGFLRVTVEV
jgi:hypothetical protein